MLLLLFILFRFIGLEVIFTVYYERFLVYIWHLFYVAAITENTVVWCCYILLLFSFENKEERIIDMFFTKLSIVPLGVFACVCLNRINSSQY